MTKETKKPKRKRAPNKKPTKPLTEKQRAALDAGRKSWEPGQSGNPDGRPPGIIDRRIIFTRILDAVYTNKNGEAEEMPFNIGGKATLLDKIVLGQVIKATVKHDTNAAEFLMNGRFGKETEKREIDIPGGIMVQIIDDIK